ncbi:MAG: flagellar assembly peptidoglycan hydrolase FlgJ [Porticoccaceae bacterium]|nr:flagellar assembly peptidoglycan hydrolase FlgJ [Pseudomonadales bacterium]MCP5173014.1 flagellar assembly peptidoglycan hydrolase FlgJ [Pseudomonadales bacterium]MCP5302487.1 flagellar assembly peptidoglycan hydrolase FlgJ [Pseudomonadales bacterium]
MSIATQNTAPAALYSDFQHLASLRSDALSAPTEAVEEVATHFESLFMQMMLKSMRDATIEGDLFNSDQMEMYQSMFDQQISLDMSRQGKLGLKDILVEQLGGEKPLLDEPQKPEPIVSLHEVSSSMRRQVLGMVPAAGGEVRPIYEVADRAPAWLPESPEQFIRDVWDHAVNAASELGVDPQVLVAQSALETGWGKKVIRAADGSSSFNLFGIKANGDWKGGSAVVNTVEYRDGLASIEKAAFRVYDSLASSFDDYVSFLKANPRYQQALEKVSDSSEFVSELQSAGYATDPQYAEKIMNIVNRDTLDNVVGELKSFTAVSI